MRITYFQKDLSNQDFRNKNLIDAYFGECNLKNTKWKEVPNVTFYKNDLQKSDWRECLDMNAAYFRYNDFKDASLPNGFPLHIHDIIKGTILTYIDTAIGKNKEVAIKAVSLIEASYEDSWHQGWKKIRKTFSSKEILDASKECWTAYPEIYNHLKLVRLLTIIL